MAPRFAPIDPEERVALSDSLLLPFHTTLNDPFKDGLWKRKSLVWCWHPFFAVIFG